MHDFKVDTPTGSKKNATAVKYFRGLICFRRLSVSSRLWSYGRRHPSPIVVGTNPTATRLPRTHRWCRAMTVRTSTLCGTFRAARDIRKSCRDCERTGTLERHLLLFFCILAIAGAFAFGLWQVARYQL